MWNACDGSRFNFQFWQCYQRSLQPYKKGPIIDRGVLGRKDLFSEDGAIMLVCAKRWWRKSQQSSAQSKFLSFLRKMQVNKDHCGIDLHV